MDEIPATRKILDEQKVHELISSTSVFKDLSDEDFDELVGNARILALQSGEILVKQGESATSLFVILDGELEVKQSKKARNVPVGIRTRGDVVGETALLLGATRNATIEALTAVRVLEIDEDAFNSWLERHPAAVRTMFSTIIKRLQSAEAHILQHQHLSALGTLAAGLAHELNNPTSAIVRGIGQLQSAVLEWQQLTREMVAGTTGTEARIDFAKLEEFVANPPDKLLGVDPLTRSDEETSIANWLSSLGVESPYRLAGTLVDFGWDADSLKQATEGAPSEVLPTLVRWLTSGSSVTRLMQELHVSAGVVSELVSAVRSYSRLDEAPMQNVDLHAGIEQSLTILRYKLRSVEIERDFDSTIPVIEANPGELNQLWTNLIANAAEATGEGGHVTIRTSLEDDEVIIDVIDDGPGIPDDIQSRIFEPFFTTKPPGEGTGLGLAISNAIVQRHRGTINLSSRPGCTRFEVRLPVTRDRAM